MSTVEDFKKCVEALTKDSNIMHEIVHGDENSVIDTDNGKVKSAANAIKALGLTSSYMLKDLSNALDDSLAKIGFAGFSKQNGTHNKLSEAKLENIAKNSIFSFDQAEDAPYSGQGLVHTMLVNNDNGLQVVYRLDKPVYYMRVKSSGVWNKQWIEVGKLDDNVEKATNDIQKLSVEGDMLFFDGIKIDKLPIGNANEVLSVVDNKPRWQSVVARTQGSLPSVVALMENAKGATYGAGVIMSDGTIRTSWHEIGDGGPIQSNSDSLGFYRISIGYDVANRVVKLVGSQQGCIFAIMSNGEVYAWGRNNSNGQLGVGNTASILAPTQVLAVSNITDVSCSDLHTLFLASTGQIYATGSNLEGQLGIGNFISQSIPQLIIKKNFKKIFTGAKASFAIDENDDLYVWGDNSAGQLGIEDKLNKNIPVKLLESVEDLSYSSVRWFSSAGSALILRKNGKVYGIGANYAGQLGNGTFDSPDIPTEITVLSDDNIAILIVGGSYVSSSFVIKNDGSVWSTGNNSNGILGHGNNISINVFTEVLSSKRTNAKVTKMYVRGWADFQSSKKYTNYLALTLFYDDGYIAVSGYRYAVPELSIDNNALSFTGINQPRFVKMVSMIDLGSNQHSYHSNKTAIYLDDQGRCWESSRYTPRSFTLSQLLIL